MKFKSEPAKAAYDEILEVGIIAWSNIAVDYERGKLKVEIHARAIEVASKIEIECLKAQFEQDERWTEKGWVPQGSSGGHPDPCEHNWVSAKNKVVSGGCFCTKCYEVRGEIPK